LGKIDDGTSYGRGFCGICITELCRQDIFSLDLCTSSTVVEIVVEVVAEAVVEVAEEEKVPPLLLDHTKRHYHSDLLASEEPHSAKPRSL